MISIIGDNCYQRGKHTQGLGSPTLNGGRQGLSKKATPKVGPRGEFYPAEKGEGKNRLRIWRSGGRGG